jgi:hypothetical protein
MPSDVSVDLIARSTTAAVEARPVRRLPIGVGLTIGACASVALWTVIGISLRALLA